MANQDLLERLAQGVVQWNEWCSKNSTLGDLDLRGADLRGASLGGAALTGADLSGADLRGALLCSADLKFSVLCGSDLRRADLRNADCFFSDLRGADLRGADLRGANLCSKDVSGANFDFSNVRGANFQATSFLEQKQIDSAEGDEKTVLPDNLLRPPHWQLPDAARPQPSRIDIDGISVYDMLGLKPPVPTTSPPQSTLPVSPPPPPPPQVTLPVSQPPIEKAVKNGYAITGLLFGIAGIFLFDPFSIIPILAIVFGGIGINRAYTRPGRPGKVAAWIGLALGIVYTFVACTRSLGLR